MTKNLHPFFLTAFFVLSVILGALLDQIHADISEINETKPQVHSMRLEMLNNGQVHSYLLDGVNYKLVRSDDE